MNISINPKLVLKFFLIIIAILITANSMGLIVKANFEPRTGFFLIEWFDVNIEGNFPTIYSSLAIMLASALLFFITIVNKEQSRPYLYWLGLAVIFLFLSVDEIASLHETLLSPVRKTLNTSVFFYYAWIIPYSIGLVVFLSVYIKFLFSLEKRIRWLFIISGLTFVMSAVGFGAISGKFVDLYGWKNFVFGVLYTIEETLEMVGIALFIYTLLTYIADKFEYLIISFKRLENYFILKMITLEREI